VEEELITKFSQQKGNAAAFYNIDSDGDVVEATEE
jgi:hypothetical protein